MPDHAQRGAAKREGVLRAGRLLVDRPEAGQGVELVGERHGDGDGGGRDGVGGAEGGVVLGGGGGDGGRLPCPLGVVAAHGALELGELVDHLAGEVGLGELRRPFGEVGVGADGGGELAGQRGDAGDALALGAELAVEGDVVELGEHRVERGAEVVPPEELGVGEAGGQDAGVAGEDGGAVVGGLAVGDDEVAGDAAGSRVAEREELLVLAHRGLEHLGRQVEEAGLDAADERHRPFGEAGVLGEEALVVDELEAGGEGELDGVVVDPPDPARQSRGGRRRARAWRRSPRRRRRRRARGRGSGGRGSCRRRRGRRSRAARPRRRRGGRGCRGSTGGGGPSAGCRRPSASTSARGSRGPPPRRSRRRSRRRGGLRARRRRRATSPFLSGRVSSWSRVRPVARRKPSIACSGASARGPLRSSRSRGDCSARPSSARVRRRGVAKAAAWA